MSPRTRSVNTISRFSGVRKRTAAGSLDCTRLRDSSGSSCAQRPEYFGGQIVRERLFALGLELLGRAEAVIRAPLLDEHARARLIFSEPLGRSIRAHGAADLWPFIPVEAEPAQILEDRRVGVGRRALDVGVFDAQDERTVLPARKQPVEERRADVADVKMACGARSESDAHDRA